MLLIAWNNLKDYGIDFPKRRGKAAQWLSSLEWKQQAHWADSKEPSRYNSEKLREIVSRFELIGFKWEAGYFGFRYDNEFEGSWKKGRRSAK